MNRRKMGAAVAIGLVLIVAVVSLHLFWRPSSVDEEQDPVLAPDEPDNRT